MRVLVTGAGGQLGRSLVRLASARGHEVAPFTRTDLDVTDGTAVSAVLAEQRPHWTLHTAAATKVDLCESEVAWAEAVNATAPGIVAKACRAAGSGMLHYSTDFVFDGGKGEPYVETDPIAPLSVYGRTKAEGERAVQEAGLERWLLVRTQWVYGPGGPCFPTAILDKARAGEPLRVVEDQRGSPTMTDDLANATLDLIDAAQSGVAAWGIYHAANRGVMSWFDFAKLIVTTAGVDAEIAAISSDELALPARRPAYSALDTTKLEVAIARPLPSVVDGLIRFLEAGGLTGYNASARRGM